ncbi:hypothetical protein Tco_0352791 [Tanacetum coccineum]
MFFSHLTRMLKRPGATNQWTCRKGCLSGRRCIDLDGMERSILAKVKDLSVISELLKHMSSEGFDDVGLRYVGGRWVWLEFDSMDQVESVKTSKALKEIFLEFKDTYRIIATEFAYWAPKIESMEVNSESNPLERKDAEGPSLDESLENVEHLDVDSCDSDSPKNVNNDSVSPSSRVLREEDVQLEDDAGEILGVHSQGDCGNVTTDDNEDVTPVIAPEKDSIIGAVQSTPRYDLNYCC